MTASHGTPTSPSSRETRSAPRRGLSVALAAVGAAALAAPVEGQTFRYGLSEKGRLVLDGTIIDKLSVKSSVPGLNRWWDAAVFGADRYSLRLDGRIQSNGLKLYDLPLVDDASWGSLAVAQDGDTRRVWALRDDGLLTRDGDVVGMLPGCTGCAFFDVVAVDDTAYSLRTDGAVFQEAIQGPVFTFDGPEGVGDHDDGTHVDTWWARMVLSPVDGDLYALRQDGVIFRGVLPGGDSDGQFLADLPSGSTAASALLTANLWVGIDILADGDWVALRGDGRVHSADLPGTVLLDFAGDPLDSGTVGETFLALDTQGQDIWALRWDGRLFRGDAPGKALIKFPGDRYRALALGDTPPDLTNIENGKPALARYMASTVEGTDITLPVLATDTDSLAEDLVIELVSELPEGASFDARARTLTWTDPGPAGKYTFVFTVDDGNLKKPVKAKQVIRVLAADTVPEKNKKPVAAKVKGVLGLVGIPLVLPILAADVDGDELVVEPVTTQGIFALEETDAAFDAETGVLTWTPRLENIGKIDVRFTVFDGTVTRKLKIPLKVSAPLIFPEG